MSDIKIVVGAVDNASRVLDQVRSSLGNVQAAGAKITGLLGGAGVVAAEAAAVALWVRNINNGVDALNDVKDATGASIENISALEDVAARTGTSFETVGSALSKFNKLLNDAKPGSEAEASLNALGLSAKELKAIDPAEALLKYAQAINGFADDGNKARLVQDQLGRSYRELAPFLKDLAEAGKLNAKVTTEQAEEAERFNKQLFELEKNIKDASRSLVSDLVTSINLSVKAVKEGGGAIEAFRAMFTGDDQHKNNVALVEQTDELLQLENEILQLRASGSALDAASARKKEERLKVLQAEIKTTMAYRQVLSEGAGSAKSEPPKPAVVAPPEKVKKRAQEISEEQRALASYVKTLENQLSTAEKLTEEQQALNFLKSIGALGEVAQVRELVLGQAQRVDQLKAEAEMQRVLEEARKPHAKYLADLAQEQAQLEETNQKMAEQVEEIGLTKDELNALHLARLDNLIATEQQNLADQVARNGDSIAIALLEQKIGLLKQQRDLTAQGQVRQAQADAKAEQDKASKEFADTLRNDLKGAFSAAFRDSKDPLKAFGDALENVIYSRAATALSEALMEYLAQLAASNAASGSGGDWTSSLLSFLPSFDGGGTTGGGTRSGGLDGKGGFLSLLHPNETVLDHTRGQTAGGGSVSVVQHISIDARSDQASIMAAMAAARDSAIRAIADSKARGGAFA